MRPSASLSPAILTSFIPRPCGSWAATAHLAQDVAQTVFTDLARKAKRFLRTLCSAAGFTSNTCFTASKPGQDERRRHAAKGRLSK